MDYYSEPRDPNRYEGRNVPSWVDRTAHLTCHRPTRWVFVYKERCACGRLTDSEHFFDVQNYYVCRYHVSPVTKRECRWGEWWEVCRVCFYTGQAHNEFLNRTEGEEDTYHLYMPIDVMNRCKCGNCAVSDFHGSLCVACGSAWNALQEAEDECLRTRKLFKQLKGKLNGIEKSSDYVG